jgi:diguanylate cyclase (GGDEF)-like protein
MHRRRPQGGGAAAENHPMGRLFLPTFLAGVPRPQGFDARAEQTRLAEVVLRCATALVSSDEEAQSLIQRKCHLLTTMVPHLVLAWTWFGRPDADTLRPQVVAGPASAYAHELLIERTPLTAIGPAFRTLAGRRLEPFNVSTASLYGPWRAAARDHGVRSVLALPLASTHDEQRGLFVLYSDVPGYFDAVGVGLFEAIAQLFGALLSRAARNAELARSANQDVLTGLPNRRALDILGPSLHRPTAAQQAVAVLMIDVDHFKRVNDLCGHAAGDAALRHVAEVLRGGLRGSDVLVRWGGEEFAAVLPGVDDTSAAGIAEKLRLRVAAAPIAGSDGQRSLTLTVSIGMAQLGVAENLVAALGRADAALYLAKRSGRDRVEAAPPPDRQP